MEPGNNNKVSLFNARKAGSEFRLDESDSCGKPKKRHGRSALLICLIVLALIVIAACLFITFNLFGSRDFVEQYLFMRNSPAPEEEPSESFTAIEESSAEESEALSQSDSEDSPDESAGEDEPYHGWVINQFGYTYLYNGCGIEQFNFTEKTLGKVVDQMQALNSKVKSSSRLYCMPIPTRISYYLDEIPQDVRREDNFFNSSQRDFLEGLNSSLPSSMKLINLCEEFAFSYKQGSDPYFRSDKNWTSDGAYVAYQKYCETRGFTPVDLGQYEKVVKEGFLGSFYNATNDSSMRDSPEQFAAYRNDSTEQCENIVYQNGLTFKNYCVANNYVTDVTDSYFIYLGTSGAHFRITSKAGTGNKMLILGDQSAAAMIPFLINHYNQIDYYDINGNTESIEDILGSNRYNDILVCSYITNMVKGDFPENMSSILGISSEATD